MEDLVRRGVEVDGSSPERQMRVVVDVGKSTYTHVTPLTALTHPATRLALTTYTYRYIRELLTK